MRKILAVSIFLLILANISVGRAEETDPFLKSFNHQAEIDHLKYTTLKKTGCDRARIKNNDIDTRQLSNVKKCYYNVYYKDNRVEALEITVTKVRTKYNKKTQKKEQGNAYLISRDRRREFSATYIDVLYQDIATVLIGTISPKVNIDKRRLLSSRAVYLIRCTGAESYTGVLTGVLVTGTQHKDGNFDDISIVTDSPEGYLPIETFF